MAVQTQIQTRRGTAASWTSTNPTLAAGEIGFESDTNKFKIGTGSTAWTALAYAANVSPLTTKGDLYTYSTANARLAVGANGESLVADSSTSTGLRYQEPLNLNPVLNSGFDIFQRGTASTAIGSGTFLADRWQAARGGFAAGASQSRQVTGDTTNLPNIQYCLRVQRDSGTTGTAYITMGQNVETVNSIPYAGKTVTMSFYARAGANFSATSSILGAELASGTGTDQNLVTAGTLTGIDRTTENKTLTTTWQRFTITKAVASTATQLCMQFYFTPTGTAGAADYFEITGVMINIGSAAYPFRRTTGTIQGELAACQRYYYRGAGGSLYSTYGAGYATLTTEAVYPIKLPVTMRVKPTALEYSTLGVGFYNVDTYALTNLVFNTQGNGQDWANVVATVASVLTQYRPYDLTNRASTAGYIAFSAEL
jgi:hypothetical protein